MIHAAHPRSSVPWSVEQIGERTSRRSADTVSNFSHVTRLVQILLEICALCAAHIPEERAKGVCTVETQLFSVPSWVDWLRKMSLPIQSISHLSRVVADVDTTAAFYIHVLGFAPIRRPSCLNCEGCWVSVSIPHYCGGFCVTLGDICVCRIVSKTSEPLFPSAVGWARCESSSYQRHPRPGSASHKSLR